MQIYWPLTIYLSFMSGWFAGAPTARFHLLTGLFPLQFLHMGQFLAVP